MLAQLLKIHEVGLFLLAAQNIIDVPDDKHYSGVPINLMNIVVDRAFSAISVS